jgi:hypothetical protein
MDSGKKINDTLKYFTHIKFYRPCSFFLLFMVSYCVSLYAEKTVHDDSQHFHGKDTEMFPAKSILVDRNGPK